MKRFSVVVALLLSFWGAQAQGPDDQYINIYSLIQEAGKLNSSGQPGEALPKYLEAQTALQQFKKGYPEWNPNVISFRMKDVAARIAELSPRVPVATTNGVASPTASPPQATKQAPSDWETQLSGLSDQVRQLQADKAVLEAKLKESLSVQPAAVDPRELVRAQEKIRNLQKENDLFRVSLAQEKSKPLPAPDTSSTAKSRQDLAAANRKLAEQTKTADTLAREKKALSAEAEAATALRAENKLLKKQLADFKSAPPPAVRTDEASRELARARTQIAALQSDKEMLQLEKAALENRIKRSSAPAPAIVATPAPAKAADANRIKQLEKERDDLRKQLATANAVAVPAPTKAADANRIKQLERERDDLQKQLNAAKKDVNSRKAKATAARLVDLERQLADMRARLQVYEARQTPYTPEELALFKQPESKLAEADHPAARKSAKELPPGTVALVAEANRYYANKQLDKAEEKYVQVLQQDNKNVPTLANLASIQLDLDHLDVAETNIKQAIALAPDDPYSLLVMGRLRFRQKKYDEAIDALSRAAKFDPQDAQIQNFLGLALSEKGLRGPAETALRKAIQLDPGYANAHNNLAVVYITQKPPLVELARWHYQKALAAGQPKNEELERMLAAKKPGSSGE